MTVLSPNASKTDNEHIHGRDSDLQENNKKSGLKRQRSLGSLSSSTSLNKLDLLLVCIVNTCYYSDHDDISQHACVQNFVHPLKIKSGQQKLAAGYQADLICFIPWQDSQTPTPVTALALNSAYGLYSYCF